MKKELPEGHRLLISPRQAAKLLGMDVRVLKSLPIPVVPVPTRGALVRRHVRYRLCDIHDFGSHG